jgi:oligopeptide transport system substrate-binding protein
MVDRLHGAQGARASQGSSRREFLQRVALGALAVGVAPPLLAACSGDNDTDTDTDTDTANSTGGTTSNGLQRFTIPAQAPQTIIPGFGFDLGSQMAILAAWSGLYAWDPTTYEPVPAEAEAYDVSDDGLTHTLTLKPDLVWSDGKPHVAGDYLFGIKYRFDKGLLFDPPWLVGMLEVFEGAGFEALGVEAPDDRTVVFRTTNPVPFFTKWLAGEYNYWPLPPHALADQAAEDALNRAEPFVGNGAYVITKLDSTSVVFDRNPSFAGEPPAADGLTLRVFPSTRDAAAFTAFRAGEVDVSTLSIADLSNAQADQELSDRVSILEWQNPLLIALNHASGPLSDVRVRQALYAALDRESIASDLFRGSATPAYQVLGPTYAGHDADRRPFEVTADRARALLAEAGFPGGEGFPRLTYQNLAIAGLQELAQVIQAMWKDVLGIDIQINGVDSATFSEKIFGPEGGWGDMSDLPWPEYFRDPADSLYGLYSFGGLYVKTGWQGHDDELQAQQDEAVFEVDAARRQQLLADYDFAVLEQMPMIPVVFINDAQVRAADVDGAFVSYGPGFAGAFAMRRGG